MSRICTICARGGSKGIPGKNARQLAGRPLLAHTVAQALDCDLFDAVAVSSDSPQLLEIAGQWGARYLIQRPAALASDDAPKMPAIRHCVEQVESQIGKEFATIVDLAVTAPLRELSDVEGAVALLEQGVASTVTTASPAQKSPYFSIVELDENGRAHYCKTAPSRLARRQDAPPCFDLNGAVYAWRRSAVMRPDAKAFGPDTVLYLMPPERAIDIDNEIDFKLAALLLACKMGDRGILDEIVGLVLGDRT